jgi:hypothetical protein
MNSNVVAGNVSFCIILFYSIYFLTNHVNAFNNAFINSI